MIDDGWLVGWGGGRVTLLPSMGPTDGGEERRDVSLSLSLSSPSFRLISPLCFQVGTFDWRGRRRRSGQRRKISLHRPRQRRPLIQPPPRSLPPFS